MTVTTEEGKTCFSEIVSGDGYRLTEVLINDTADRGIHDVIERATAMHTEFQRAILDGISEGEFHLVAVFTLHRTLYKAFPDGVISLFSKNRQEEVTCHILLENKLFLVRQSLICTSSTSREGGAYMFLILCRILSFCSL